MPDEETTPDQPAPDEDLRAAREQIQKVSAGLRKALADDDRLAGPPKDDER